MKRRGVVWSRWAVSRMRMRTARESMFGIPWVSMSTACDTMFVVNWSCQKVRMVMMGTLLFIRYRPV